MLVAESGMRTVESGGGCSRCSHTLGVGVDGSVRSSCLDVGVEALRSRSGMSSGVRPEAGDKPVCDDQFLSLFPFPVPM